MLLWNEYTLDVRICCETVVNGRKEVLSEALAPRSDTMGAQLIASVVVRATVLSRTLKSCLPRE